MHIPSFLKSLGHSHLDNYILPGLTSALMGGVPGKSTVRLFEASRTQHSLLTPHSHRFDFVCLVLEGHVFNNVWRKHPKGDEYQSSKLQYQGEPGAYVQTVQCVDRWVYDTSRYNKDDWYEMQHDSVHSIVFSKGALVLFFEGPTVSDTSLVLEPHVNGDTVQTAKVEPWMFLKREDGND